jgi:hypothetical protein
MIPFADNFLAGAWLTWAMPIALLAVIAFWFVRAVRHVPGDTPEASSKLPAPEVVAAAGPAVDEIQPIDPSPGPGGGSGPGGPGGPGPGGPGPGQL